MRIETMKERVANGARWLDENFPGWTERIDPATLHLSDGMHCICGQVFAEEVKGVDNLDGFRYAEKTLLTEANGWIESKYPKGEIQRGTDVAMSLGFLTTEQDAYDYDEYAYEHLQNVWIDLLRSREPERDWSDGYCNT